MRRTLSFCHSPACPAGANGKGKCCAAFGKWRYRSISSRRAAKGRCESMRNLSLQALGKRGEKAGFYGKRHLSR
ncbi:hypothetical protein [Acetomicrobium mobile]|uniref:hypothetical protein n=1 Tax=Acetomicrobium mobile TaxID=97477 RepID=UPI0026ECA917|nr:hypothetical protein [Acetomicrobium mobile]